MFKLGNIIATRRNALCGHTLDYMTVPMHCRVLEIYRNLIKRGYHALIFMAGKDMQSIDGVIEEILDYQVEGIITASVSMSSNLTKVDIFI